MTYKLYLEMLYLPKQTNRRGSSHWRGVNRERNEVKAAIGILAKAHRMPQVPLYHAKLTLTRYSSVCPDPDGLVSGFKSVLDGLVECGVLENDRFTNIGMPTYLWKKAKKGEGKISISVVEAIGLEVQPCRLCGK